MSHPINSQVYDRILEDEGFLNDLWNKFDTTSKIEALEKLGFDLFNEWVKINGDENQIDSNN
jgi:hypothetical protein